MCVIVIFVCTLSDALFQCIQGKLDLYDLKLKKSALDKLNVPFEIVEGVHE